MPSRLARLLTKRGKSFSIPFDRSRLRTLLGVTPLEDRTVPATVAVTLFATGVAADGLALGDDATDPHYELISNGGTALMPGAARTLTADGFPISPWVGNDPNSRWIVPIATDGDGNAAVGTFAYRTTFDLTGIDPTTVTIAGQWAADNDATIVLNGVSTGVSMAAEDFQSLSAFSLSGGFRAGVNTLDFVVHNAGGPTGLRVAVLTGSGETTDQVGVAGVAFNTGVDTFGHPLAAGAIDPHWTVVDAPEASLLGATKVVPGDAYPFPVWVGNDGNSRWIAPQGAGADASAPPGTYKYQTTLDLTGYDPTTAVLSGRWSADNEGVNVYLNGVPLNLSVTGANPGSGVEAYRGYADLYLAHGVGGAAFVAGVNTLTFELRNDQLSAGNDAANPVGLRVDDLHLSATELPHVDVTAISDASEDGAVGRFRLTRTGDVSQPLTVVYQLGGTATMGADYKNRTGVVTFAAGNNTTGVRIVANDDAEAEPTETAALTLLPGAAYALGAAYTGTVRVLDNDAIAPPGTGDGLFGRYYVGKNFAEVREARIDKQVDFLWHAGTPFSSIGTDLFSIRWTGKVEAPASGKYVFVTDTDDGVRLWVDGKLVINSWRDQGGAASVQESGSVTLAAGQKYDIRLEYHENTGGAKAALKWNLPGQQKATVIPQERLYSNTATVGDLVWVDANGNGTQDLIGQAGGESGAAGVRVQAFGGTEGETDAVPAVTTDASGHFSFLVPAEGTYRLRFGGGSGQYGFTDRIADDVQRDSDANEDGFTAAFRAPSAGQTDLTLDAGLRGLFDLDVNANGSLGDAVDGAAGYLPGYEGGAQKVSEGASFNTDVYKRQRMKLVLEGFGSATPNIARIDFQISIPATTSYPGYASNKTDPSIAAQGKTDRDYSFKPNENWDDISISPTSAESGPDGLKEGGRMEANRAWVNFYAKDYGGTTEVRVTVYVKDADGNPQPSADFVMSIPIDSDGDKLADLWERQMADRWVAQHGGRIRTATEVLTVYYGLKQKNGLYEDVESKDPDGAGPLVAQKEVGDGHDIIEEYRGYILDGGGFDGQGKNGFKGGHIRLDPARKEILLEVDRAAKINNIPAGGLNGVLDGASKVFSNADRGAGVFMYYLFDEVNLDLPKNKVNTARLQGAAWEASRDTPAARTGQGATSLKSDFIHFLFVDENGQSAKGETGAITDDSNFQYDRRGSMIAISDMKSAVTGTDLDPDRFDEFLMTSVAHEIVHQLIRPGQDRDLKKQYEDAGKPFPFNREEHTVDSNQNGTPNELEDQSCLMYDTTDKKFRAGSELATVRFFPIVQSQLRFRTSDAFE